MISNMNNETKTLLQKREFEALKDKHRVLLKWATGCGKSKMTIDLINHQVDPLVSGKFKHKILFVVAERAHIKNWEAEFDKWQLKRVNVCTDVCCYASLKKYKQYTYDIVVLDEGHHALAPKAYEHLTEMTQSHGSLITNVYVLSATLSSGKQDMLEDIFGKFTTSTITLKDAIQSDILSDPKVYVVAMELDDQKVNQEITVRKGDNPMVVNWEQRNKYKFKNVPYIIRCTQKQKYLWYTNEMEYWKQRYENSHNSFHHNYWVNLGSQRKRFLGEQKGDVVYSLISRLNLLKKRFVCFCASVNQANSFSQVGTISSKKSMKYNQKIIDGFNAGKLNHIYAVGMITEGMNLTDIQVGIIVQLDGKERLFVQKFGRSMRAEDPVSFIFYFKNTQDENYLKTALENIDAKYVQHININQLKTIKL